MSLDIAPVTAQEYLAFIDSRPASFLQSPSWPAVKNQWGSQLLGWLDGGRLVGVAVVLTRTLPLVGRPLAVLAEGPVIDWSRYSTGAVVDPLVEHLRAQGAVSLRLGPDLALHRWNAATVKDQVGQVARLRDVVPDVIDPVGARLVADLAAAGWRRPPEGDGVYGATRHSFRIHLAGRTPDELMAAMNQQWRRAIRRADKAGVVVERGEYGDLVAFHRLYVETARRDGFVPFPLDHFQRAWKALAAEAPDRIRLYLAKHEGEPLAAMLVTRTGGLGGYAYGGSATVKREFYPSNAAHWRILRDLLAEGAEVYDMRGVGDSLDPEDRRFGVLRFKLGTGGEVVEHVGNWELVLQPALHRATTTAWRLSLRLPALRALPATVMGRIRAGSGGRGQVLTPAPS